MGKRSTIAYSSEDFIKKRHKKDDNDTKTDDDKSALKTYYCTCCSNPVLITDCNLFSLPRRRKDGSIILDRTKYVCRLRAKRERDNKTTAIRRDNGKSIEKQTRYYCGDVPVCYECNDESVKLYVLDGALRSFEKARKAGTNGKEKGNTTREVVELLPVPPCIRRGKGGKKLIISVRVIDRQEKCSVMDISAEKVSISATKKADAKESLGARSLSVLVNDEEDDGVAVTKEIACDVGESMSPETPYRSSKSTESRTKGLGRENAATTASINAVEINSRAKQMNHREKEAEQEERRWRTMATTTTSNVAESLKVSKLEIELERLEAQVRVMKKDVRMARADCARERQTVAHERRRCEELTSTSGQTMKENEELRMVLEKTERERDELKRDFVDLGDRATVIAKQNEYAKREYERCKKEADEMRAKAKEETKAAKESEKRMKTAEKRISEKFEEEKVQMERRAMKWRDEVLRKASKAKASLEKREKNVKRKEESQESIERREKEKYEAKVQKMRMEFEHRATEIEREANERGAAAVARFGARASETEVAAVAEAQFAKDKMDEALKECAVAKAEKESYERKSREAERARKDIADALEKETLQRLKYQAELEVFRVQSEPLKDEIESEKGMKDDFKKRLEMSLGRNVELQEDVETLSSSKRVLLDAKTRLKAENMRLNALIKETIESYKQKIETLKEDVKASNEKAMQACFDDAKNAVETCYQESSELKRRVEDLTEKLAVAQNFLQTREEERDVATESLELTMRELEAKTSEIEQLEESLQSAKNTTNQISASMQQLVNDYDEMQNDLEAAALKINELTVENIQLSSMPPSTDKGVNTTSDTDNSRALAKRMEKEKEIAISIESERVREKLQKLFDTRTKALNEQNQALLQIMNVMKSKVDATETNFKEEFEKRKEVEADLHAKSKEIERLQSELSSSSRKLRLLEDALSVVPSSTISKEQPFFDAKDDDYDESNIDNDFNNGETFFIPSVPKNGSDIRALIASPKRSVSKRVGFNKTSPLMRPNPPPVKNEGAKTNDATNAERGLW
ncbi:unnamed protein product [Bathycoccus prasinos]